MPETFALLALMHLHLARMTARQGGSGGLLLLEEQDRALWDRQRIQVGLEWLAKSAQGDDFSRYHAEADRSLPNTQTAPWVALAEWRGPAAGLAVLTGFEPPTWLTGSYLWAAVLADLHRRVQMIPFVGMTGSPIQIWMGTMMQLVVTAFLMWYSKHVESKGWIS